MNNEILNILLRDKTTGKNILWANAEHGAEEIQAAQIDSIVPRYLKDRSDQKQRTRDRAEIFTPPEICAIQNDLIWEPREPREYWTDYVDAKFLEITCGEAPYIVSRYNAVTGDAIPLVERRGLLDRKLNVVSNHTDNVSDWLRWAGVALCSVYGYEFQGDNLFLARQNVLWSFNDHFEKQFPKARLSDEILCSVAEIISWNLWQMDGRTDAIPYYVPPTEKPKSKPKTDPNQGTLDLDIEPPAEAEPPNVYCRILDWRTCEVVEFKSLTKGAK